MSKQLNDKYNNNPFDFEKFVQYNAIEKKISESEMRLREEQRISEQRLYATCARIESKLDAHIVETKQSFERIEDKFARFEDKFERLEGKFEHFKMWLIGIFIAVILGIGGTIATIIFT